MTTPAEFFKAVEDLVESATTKMRSPAGSRSTKLHSSFIKNIEKQLTAIALMDEISDDDMVEIKREPINNERTLKSLHEMTIYAVSVYLSALRNSSPNICSAIKE